jgi:Uma2 family endonuclease
MPGTISKRAFTADEFQKLDQLNFFGPEERLELIDGEIRAMSPINPRHAAVVSDLVSLLHEILDKNWIVRCQAPLLVSGNSLPQPDVCVVRTKPDRYTKSHPTASDSALVIEVADSSAHTDLGQKKDLYATSGVPEYWVFDLTENSVECFQKPQDGAYQQHISWPSAASAQSLSLGIQFPLATLLGKE